jgi:hypothetical protein
MQGVAVRRGSRVNAYMSSLLWLHLPTGKRGLRLRTMQSEWGSPRRGLRRGQVFFFTVREECPLNKDGQPRWKVQPKPGRATASWKATRPVLEIRRPQTGEVIGKRRMLTYCSGCPNACGTGGESSEGEAELEGCSRLCTMPTLPLPQSLPTPVSLPALVFRNRLTAD